MSEPPVSDAIFKMKSGCGDASMRMRLTGSAQHARASECTSLCPDLITHPLGESGWRLVVNGKRRSWRSGAGWKTPSEALQPASRNGV
jgi:hypothetical protein